MKRKILFGTLIAGAMTLVSCFGNRYMSADTDLESIYIGHNYYEVTNDFGRPNQSIKDGMNGTKVTYYDVSLLGTRAARLYTDYKMRNRVTKMTGEPVGELTFYFNPNMKCYAVESDFQRQRVKAPKTAPVKVDNPDIPRYAKPKLPRVVKFPSMEHRSPNAEVVSIEKIEMDAFQTKIYFKYQSRTPKVRPLNDFGIAVNKYIYLEDLATHKHYDIRDVEGISIYPEYTQFAHNDGGYDVLVYSMTFAPLTPETKFINIIEPGHSGFSFYNVDVRSMTMQINDIKK